MSTRPDPSAPYPSAPRWRISDWLWLAGLVACVMAWARFVSDLRSNPARPATETTRAVGFAFALAWGMTAFAAVRSVLLHRLIWWVQGLRLWLRNLWMGLISGVGVNAPNLSALILGGVGVGSPVLRGYGRARRRDGDRRVRPQNRRLRRSTTFRSPRRSPRG